MKTRHLQIFSIHYHSYLPFSALGMGWVVPALVGLVLGLACHVWRLRAAASAEA